LFRNSGSRARESIRLSCGHGCAQAEDFDSIL
jgi:hypothetical protein